MSQPPVPRVTAAGQPLSRRAALGCLAAAGSLPLLPQFAWAGEAPAGSAAARLRALIAASDEAANRLDPLPRVPAGEGHALPPFIDPLSDRYFSALKRNAERDLAGLAAIDPASLPAVDRIAYDVLQYDATRRLERFKNGLWKIDRCTPLDPSGGLHVQLPDFVSGAGAPFATPADYEAGLQRLAGFAGYLGSVITRLQQGQRSGHLQSKLVTAKVIAQLDAMLALPPAETAFLGALKRMPASFTPAERERFEAAYPQLVTSRVLPAYARLREYLATTYLPRALDDPGRWAMKDGLAMYAADLAYHTTTAATAEELHETGLREVAKLRAGMEEVRAQVGFGGDLTAFFQFIRTDPQFYYTKPEDLIARFKDIEDKIWQGMPKLFARRPKAPFAVRALPALGGQRGTGYYRPGPPDGVTPGVLWFNMAMLNTRPIPTLETLTLHEGIPGHHYQITLVLEDATLPANLRSGNITAYAEGWGLYAESLGRELGMFSDPYQWFGHLDMAMLRAVRLVVDTGMHAKRWPRQRAIDYMLANTSMAQRDVEVEIDRYLAWPGQACAYKTGELKIRALRERATAALGERFDIRAFHGQVLDTGALPLAVLERKVDRWIAAA
jgi:uncharacterized protein (DUF885 family)